MERIRPLFRLSLPGNVMVKVSFQLILHIETSETTDIKRLILMIIFSRFIHGIYKDKQDYKTFL